MLIINLNSRIVNPAPTQLRMVAVGRMSPEITELKYADASDVQMLDFVAPDYVGEMDYIEGLDCDPTRHGYRTVAKCEAYVIGYREAMAAMEAVADLHDAREDEDFVRYGC